MPCWIFGYRANIVRHCNSVYDLCVYLYAEMSHHSPKQLPLVEEYIFVANHEQVLVENTFSVAAQFVIQNLCMVDHILVYFHMLITHVVIYDRVRILVGKPVRKMLSAK